MHLESDDHFPLAGGAVDAVGRGSGSAERFGHAGRIALATRVPQGSGHRIDVRTPDPATDRLAATEEIDLQPTRPPGAELTVRAAHQHLIALAETEAAEAQDSVATETEAVTAETEDPAGEEAEEKTAKG